MSLPLLSSAVIVGLLVSAYGWGRATAALTWRDRTHHASLLAVLGLAAWAFLGGVLNASGSAHRAALGVVVALGILVAVPALPRRTVTLADLREHLNAPGWSSAAYALATLFIVGASLFLTTTLMPSRIFNFGDDFTMYLARPFQMLQTGTLGGNPFDATGIESLGVQSFFQSFILMWLPPEYVNGFDLVLCFLLASSLLVGIARSMGAHGAWLLMSLLTFVLINPQVVNISPVYSTSAMTLGMIAASNLFADSPPRSDIRSVVLGVIPLALLASALIALKMTLVVFAAAYCVLYFALLVLTSAQKKRFFLGGAAATALTFLFLAPWGAVYWDSYRQALANLEGGGVQAPCGGLDLVRLKSALGGLTSFDEMFYGGRHVGYGLVIVLLLGAALLSSFFLVRARRGPSSVSHLVGVLASSVAAMAGYVVNVNCSDTDAALRYSLPVFIAVLPYAALVVGSRLGDLHSPGAGTGRRRVPAGIMGVALALLLAAFWDSLSTRARRASLDGSLVPFPGASARSYAEYNRRILGRDARDTMRAIQARTEGGLGILVWNLAPFHVDFARNRIYTLTALGLYNPGLSLPITGGPEDLRAYLRGHGIRYVIWEYGFFTSESVARAWREYSVSSFPAYRKIGVNNLYFIRTLAALAQTSRVSYDMNGTVLLDLEATRGESGSPDPPPS